MSPDLPKIVWPQEAVWQSYPHDSAGDIKTFEPLIVGANSS